MNKAGAIAEIDWYRNLIARKLRDWGWDLRADFKELLLTNIDEVARNKESLAYKEYKDGYYIGQVDEEGLIHLPQSQFFLCLPFGWETLVG